MVQSPQRLAITQSKSSMAAAALNCAEHFAKFIFYLFEEKWHRRGIPVTIQNVTTIGSTNNGVYLFYICKSSDKHQKKKYPIYLGYTGRTFRIRFKEHGTRDNGVVNKCLGVQSFQPASLGGGPFKLFVYELPMTNFVQAKLLESIFLNAFDFALNTEENDKVRDDIDLSFTHDKAYGKEAFKSSYEWAMGGVSELSGEYFAGLDL